MKYKYEGNEMVIISSMKKIIKVNPGDTVELSDDDIRFQNLGNFTKVEEPKQNKKKKILESE